MLIGKFNFPPYYFLKTVFLQLSQLSQLSKSSWKYIEVENDYSETDVASLIEINQTSDVIEKRRDLISFLFGEPGLPTSVPSSVFSGYTDARYEDMLVIQQLEKIVVQMEFGLTSNIYHFTPHNSNKKLVLYHQGHDGEFIHGKEQIRILLEHGFSVMAFSMPLLGMNNQPTIEIDRLGKLKMTSHDHMKFLAPVDGHPIKFFIEPIVRALNYTSKNYDYSSVSMIGISGGGWTTTLAAAIDTRIGYSFPVAGSYPLYLRSNSQRDWGDYEQNSPDLYQRANYLELYILGSHGVNRKQLQILNKYDSCCFAGMKWQTYKDIVMERVRVLGEGEFDLYLDDSHQEHKISDVALSLIIGEL